MCQVVVFTVVLTCLGCFEYVVMIGCVWLSSLLVGVFGFLS